MWFEELRVSAVPMPGADSDLVVKLKDPLKVQI